MLMWFIVGGVVYVVGSYALIGRDLVKNPGPYGFGILLVPFIAAGMLAKRREQSGGPTVTGWINAFFPYMSDWKSKEPKARNKYMDPSQWDLLWGGASTDWFPSGFSVAPFTWEYLGKELPMEFIAGFTGVSQDPTTLAVRPAIGWAVAESTSRR